MGDNRRFDTPVDTDGQGAVGGPHPYGNQFMHDEDDGVDHPLGMDPNAAGNSPVFPDWWTGESDDAPSAEG